MSGGDVLVLIVVMRRRGRWLLIGVGYGDEEIEVVIKRIDVGYAAIFI